MRQGVGAPKGGRLHWLLWELQIDFKQNYNKIWTDFSDNYCFYRLNGKKFKDLFIVVRTSRRCYRVSYINFETLEMQAFTCSKALHAARRMWYIFRINERREGKI